MNQLNFLIIEQQSCKGGRIHETFENYPGATVDRITRAAKGIAQLEKYPFYEAILVELTDNPQNIASVQTLVQEIREIGYVGFIFLYTTPALRKIVALIDKIHVDGYITKPCDFARIAALIKKKHSLSPHVNSFV